MTGTGMVKHLSAFIDPEESYAGCRTLLAPGEDSAPELPTDSGAMANVWRRVIGLRISGIKPKHNFDAMDHWIRAGGRER